MATSDALRDSGNHSIQKTLVLALFLGIATSLSGHHDFGLRAPEAKATAGSFASGNRPLRGES